MEQLSIKESVLALLKYAEGGGDMGVSKPWTLSPRAVSRICRSAGGEPKHCGWAKLAAVCAGAVVDGDTLLKPTRRSFELQVPKELVEEITATELRVKLVESMTQLLVTPSLAAGIFITLGIHPAWGLRLAWGVHNHGHPNIEAAAGSDMFPDVIREIGVDMVFSVIENIMAFIYSEGHDGPVDIDSVTSRAEQAVASSREFVSENVESIDAGGLRLFIGGSPSRGVVRRVMLEDFFEDFLVPSGAVEVEAKGATWRTNNEVFEQVSYFDDCKGAMERHFGVSAVLTANA